MDIANKIEKLQAHVDAGGEEGANAERLIKILMNKHDIKASDLNEPRVQHRYKTHRLKKFAIKLGAWMGCPIYTIRGAADFVIVEVTSDEFNMFHELLGEIKHHFNKMEREYLKECTEELRERLLSAGYTIDSEVRKSIAKSAQKAKNIKLQSFMQGYMQTHFAYDRKSCRTCLKGMLKEIGHGRVKCDNEKCGTVYKSSGFHNRETDGDAFNSGVAVKRSLGTNQIRIGA